MAPLPLKQTVQTPDLRETIWILYGPPGIGKSTLASGFTEGDTKPLFLYTSPIKYIQAYKVPIESWKSFVSIVKELDRKRPKRHAFVVVDTIDFLYMHCRKEVCEGLGIEHEGDLDHGKGWDAVKKEFTRWIAKLCTLGYGVVFISHSQWREVRTRVATYDRVVPTLQGAGWRVLYPIADFVGYCAFSQKEDTDEGDRSVFFTPTEYVEAKDWTGKLTRPQFMWPDPEQTFGEMRAALSAKSRRKKAARKASTKKARKRVARRKR